MSPKGWKDLVENCTFSGQGQYPIEAYSEFMPSVKVGCTPYGKKTVGFFPEEDRYGFPVTEFEEHYELRPGLENIAHQLLDSLIHLARGQPSQHLAKNKLLDNPYWPPELAQKVGMLNHERFVLLLPLALSMTHDDKGRRRWTFFGGSEQGPSRPFWKSFFTSHGTETPPERAVDYIRTLLHEAYGEPFEKLSNLYSTGFRIFAEDDDPHGSRRPVWASTLIWHRGMSLKGVKYLLNFEPFSRLPADLQRAYLAGKLHLLPFPGSLLFWGVPGYVKMQRELPMANQIPLMSLVERHESPYGLRVPQSGWMHISLNHPLPNKDFAPIRSTFQRTNRWAKVHRYEDELATPGRQDHIAKVLFSTSPRDLDLYGKPMARNSQIWTQDYKLLLDGPNASRADIDAAIKSINQGGMFGYRFQYPPMCIGTYQVYWHRPLIAYMPQNADKPCVLHDTLTGYFTAYGAKEGVDLDNPIELWPNIHKRSAHMAVIELFKDKKQEQKTVTRALNLFDAHELMEGRKIPYSVARQILMLPKDRPLESWLKSLPEISGNKEKGQSLVNQLQDQIEQKKPILRIAGKRKTPASLTFNHTAVRSFEVQYWRDILHLSAGEYINKANSDCILDRATQRMLRHHHRDLEGLGNYLLAYYRRVIAGCGMQGKALVGDLPFRWKTDFDFNWWGGWANNQLGRLEERNLLIVIPGRDRRRAVIMADHYDTAYMEDIYYKKQGGSGARLASSGADDNHSATAALMRAAPILCELSKEGKLETDIWLIHLTGEEFPSDCLGARNLCQQLIEGTLKLRLSKDKEKNLSDVEVQGAFILDMVAHNNDNERDKFQISPGMGRESLLLAYQAHIANEIWNASTDIWNKRPSRLKRTQGRRSVDGKTVPKIALHPKLDGEIRLPHDPKSTLYNTDAQIFSDAGIPVVLFMENYDISRHGYHDSHDTMINIDLDYGAAVAAVAIEAVARVAAEEPFIK